MYVVPVQVRVLGFLKMLLHGPDPGRDVPCVQDADVLALEECLEVLFGGESAVTGVGWLGWGGCVYCG